MKKVMNIKEAREMCMDRSKWRSIVYAYPDGTRPEYMHVCMPY